MSDEHTMPEVIYAGILDACEMSSPFNGSDIPYLRCDIDPADAVVVSGAILGERAVQEQMYLDRIATLTAERDAQDAKVRELVEAWEQHDKACGDLSGAMESDLDYYDLIRRVDQTHEQMNTLAAQLKEQNDEHEQR